MNVNDVKTPELDKLLKVKDQSQTIGQFLDWMRSDKDWIVCEYNEDNECDQCGEELNNAQYTEVQRTIEQMLAEYFGVDLVKAEEERSALLEAVRSNS